MTADPVPDLTLQPIAAGSWRLCDARMPASDAASLIAYVEGSQEKGYDITWVHGGRGTTWVATMADLLSAAGNRAAYAAPRRVKPKPIPARPPLAAF